MTPQTGPEACLLAEGGELVLKRCFEALLSQRLVARLQRRAVLDPLPHLARPRRRCRDDNNARSSNKSDSNRRLGNRYACVRVVPRLHRRAAA